MIRGFLSVLLGLLLQTGLAQVAGLWSPRDTTADAGAAPGPVAPTAAQVPVWPPA